MAAANDSLFTEPELRALLERDEGQFLEFKSLWDQSAGSRRALDRRQARNLVAESVAAFANAKRAFPNCEATSGAILP